MATYISTLKNKNGDQIAPRTVKAAIQDLQFDDVMSDNSENPVENKVIKKYVDDSIAEIQIELDDEMSDTSENGVKNKIIKQYVDEQSEDTPYTLYYDEDAGTEGEEPATQAQMANKLSKDGTDAMTGALDMNSHKIIHLQYPDNDNDAATKEYVDEAIDAIPEPVIDTEMSTTSENPVQNKVIAAELNNKLSLEGGTMIGDLNMNNHKITNISNPVNANDAVNKQTYETLASYDDPTITNISSNFKDAITATTSSGSSGQSDSLWTNPRDSEIYVTVPNNEGYSYTNLQLLVASFGDGESQIDPEKTYQIYLTTDYIENTIIKEGDCIISCGDPQGVCEKIDEHTMRYTGKIPQIGIQPEIDIVNYGFFNNASGYYLISYPQISIRIVENNYQKGLISGEDKEKYDNYENQINSKVSTSQLGHTIYIWTKADGTTVTEDVVTWQ